MLIQAHLFFIVHSVFLTNSAISHPSQEHRRPQADSSPKSDLPRNVIPIIPNESDFPALKLLQNNELMFPTNFESHRNVEYFPRNTDETLAGLTEVRETSDVIPRDRKPVFRDQRKQLGPDDVEPCGHYRKNDYNMLTDIIGKMSPEARNALIDALLKTLMDKSKVSSVKSDARVLKHPLDAALEPPLRVNNKPNTLVQPFSLTVEREKLRDLYKYLNNERLQGGSKKANLTVDLGDLVQEAVKGCQCGTTKKCSHKHSTTLTPMTTSTSNTEEDDDGEDSYSCDQCGDGSFDDGGGKVINLTQIFNVHPKLIVVHSGQFTPTDIAGLLSGTQHTPNPTTPEQSTCRHHTTTRTTQDNHPIPSRDQETSPIRPTTVTQPVPATSLNRKTSKSPNSRRRCTRKGNRHSHRCRYVKRPRASPMKNLVYTYYVDMDDPRVEDD